MKLLTTNEGKVLLLICKDFATDYNANTIATKLGITRRGALNIVKTLLKEELVMSRQYGKAMFYKVNSTSSYTKEILKTILATEARQQAKRWMDQFEKLFHLTEGIIIFGSAVRNYTQAQDIDLVIVLNKKNISMAQQMVKVENNTSLKPLHVVWQSRLDFIKNISKSDPVLLNALKYGYVLHGNELVLKAILQAQECYGHFAVPKLKSR